MNSRSEAAPHALFEASLQAACDGDPFAFSALYLWTAPGLAATFHVVSPAPQLEQATRMRSLYLQVWKELPSRRFPSLGSFELWLLRLADRWIAADGADDLRGSPTTSLRSVPRIHREALCLRYLFRLTRAQVASALDVPVAKVARGERQGLEAIASAAQ